MRKMAVETLCFVFQDADGILSFSLNEYEGAPNNPRFMYDAIAVCCCCANPVS